MYEQFKGWAEEFDIVPTEQKKMIISQLISRIEIGKGYKISIKLNMDYKQFCEGWMNKEKKHRRSVRYIIQNKKVRK